jgi:hypothetical protein
MNTKIQNKRNTKSLFKALLFLLIGTFSLEGNGQTDYTLNSGTAGNSTTWGFVANKRWLN